MIRLCHIFIGLFVACVAAHAQPVFKGGVTNGSSTTTGATGQTWAVIVGISNYQFVDKLRYADKDAEVFYQFLSSPAGGSVPLSNMTLLLNENATTHQIDKTLHNLVDLVKPGDRVVIYFSGHGDQEVITMAEFGFLLTYNTNNQSYISSALFIQAFQAYIATLSTKKKATVQVYLDACRAGKLAGNEIGGLQLAGEQLAKQTANETKLMACQSNEVSLEGEQWGGGRGAFSYHLVRGLQGLADADGDSLVTTRELERYLEDRVSTEAKPMRQTPFKVGDANTVLARVHRPTLLALRANRSLPTFAAVAGKGFVETALARADTSIQARYQNFQQKLTQKEPEAAIADYEWLAAQPAVASALPFLKRELAAALMDEGQLVLNSFINNFEIDTISIQEYRKLYEKKYGYVKDYIKRQDQQPLYLFLYDYIKRQDRQFSYAAALLGTSSAFYNPARARAAFFRGITAATTQNTTAALTAFTQAIDYDSLAAFAYWGQGGLLYELKRYTEAEATYRKALQITPNWFSLHYSLGLVLDEQKRPSEAEAAYRKAIQFKPDYAEAHKNLGNLLRTQQRPSEAEVAYRKVIELKPNDADAYNYLGLVLADQKRPSEAEATYRKAIQLKPDYVWTYNNLGNVLDDLKRYTEAEATFRKAIQLDPAYFWAYYNLGRVLRTQQRPTEAEGAFRKVIELKPDYVYAYNSLGNLLDDQNRPVEAEAAFRKAIELKPDFASAHYNLGLVLEAQKRFDDASMQFQTYTQLNPNDSDGWNQLGIQFLYLKQYDKARPCFERILTLDPKNQASPYNLACLYSLQNQPAPALQWLEKALQNGYSKFDHISEDTDLDNIRNTEGFRALLTKYKPK